MKEGNSNFGNVFPWWDMLFKTYIYKTKKELMSISFGISDKESPQTNTLKNLLINPFI
jgi:sterol desaturase/sphingolipid hydroxylase (fatty acid hydroxylase superfamily)